MTTKKLKPTTLQIKFRINMDSDIETIRELIEDNLGVEIVEINEV